MRTAVEWIACVVPVEVHLHEGAPSRGPLGAKGAGEVPILNVAATVASAIADATGKRPKVDLPHIARPFGDNVIGRL